MVRDLGSTNGIRINGIRVVEGRLSTGDELTIGNSRYKVAWDALPIQAAPPGPAGTGVPPVGAMFSARKPTIREPSPVEDIEDELLESCDEPVPLDEPRREGPPGAASIPQSSPPSPSEESFLLPDVLELMPNSDLFPKNSPHSSESGLYPPV